MRFAIHAPFPPIRLAEGQQVSGSFHAVKARNGDATYGANTACIMGKTPFSAGDVLKDGDTDLLPFTTVHCATGVMHVWPTDEASAGATPA